MPVISGPQTSYTRLFTPGSYYSLISFTALRCADLNIDVGRVGL